MKVENRTRYATRVLRSILCAVHARDASTGRGRVPQWKHVTIAIGYSRRGRNQPYSGHAYGSHEPIGPKARGAFRVRGCYMHLSIPRGRLDVAQLVVLFRHELWHLYGVRHGDMPDSVLHCRTDGYAEPFVERFGDVLEEVAPPEIDRVAVKRAEVAAKLARAEARLRRWESKAKRASTGIATTEREIRRLRRRMEKL